MGYNDHYYSGNIPITSWVLQSSPTIKSKRKKFTHSYRVSDARFTCKFACTIISSRSCKWKLLTCFWKQAVFFSLLFINLFLASTNFVKPVISFEGGRFSFAAVRGLTSWRTTVELSSSAAVHCRVDAVLAPVPICSGFFASFRSFFGLISD